MIWSGLDTQTALNYTELLMIHRWLMIWSGSDTQSALNHTLVLCDGDWFIDTDHFQCYTSYIQAQKVSNFLQCTDLQASANSSTGRGLIHWSTSVQCAISFTHTLHCLEGTWQTCLTCEKLSVLLVLCKDETHLGSGVIKVMPPDGTVLA